MLHSGEERCLYFVCPENLNKAEFKSSGLINLAEEI
jgi:hypothetical protein